GHKVCPGDWIITGVKGERYPCKPDIFAQTYEPADAPASGEPSGAEPRVCHGPMEARTVCVRCGHFAAGSGAEAVVREAYNEGVVVAYDNVADSLRALIANGRRVTKRDVLGVIEGVERAASQIAPYAGRIPTAPGAPEEGAGEYEQ